MAGTITHYYFAKDSINCVKKKMKIVYNEDLLKIFAQSMDSFNFYSIYFPILPKSSNKRKFAGIFHHTKTNEFFKELINYIRDNKLGRNDEVMSFLYGLITHYVLDTTIHPYVEYKSGNYDSKINDTFKYNAKHHEMESFFDIYMLNKHGINNKRFKSHKEIFKIKNFSLQLQNTMDYVFKKVFDFKHFSKYYVKSIKDMKLSFRLFRYDPLGYKKYLFKVFDIISGKKVLNSKFLSYSYIPNNAFSLLNNEHKTWFYPYDTFRQYDLSFDELYDVALKECSKIIIDINNYIKKKKELDLDTIFCKSYSSGISWYETLNTPIYEF